MSQEKAHYDHVMKDKVLPDIKEAETLYLELKKGREVHFQHISNVNRQNELLYLHPLFIPKLKQLSI